MTSGSSSLPGSSSLTSSGVSSSSSGFGSSGLGSGSDKVEAFLGKGSKVVGNLTFTGPVELDGYIEGEILSQDRLVIGEAAVINARISGAEVLVKGTVNGDISASKRLSLKRPARVVGNISTTNLSIEEGVVFEGKSSMGGSPKPGDVRPSSGVVTAGKAPDKVGATV